METTSKEYICPCCGGAIEFNTQLQKMKCPYCDTEFELSTLENFAKDNDEIPAESMEWENDSDEWSSDETDRMSLFICNSCAGEIFSDENTAATFCPFCGNPVVNSGRLSGVLRPDFVIPFKLDKKAAVDALSKHLTGKKLLPSIFKDQNHIEEIKGIYVPFWLYEANADAAIQYRATRVRHWSDSSYDYTETSHYSLFRSGSMAFDNVPVDGSKSIADDLMESIEPFDYSEAVDFNTAYLSGFFADKYDVSQEECKPRANERVKNSTIAAFNDTAKDYTTVSPVNTSVNLTEGKTRYALLPVWLLTTKWNNETYTFAMNGQTGKFVGNLPVDKGKYAAWFFGLFGGISAAIIGLSYLIWLL